MTTSQLASVPVTLENRRRAVGMTFDDLARRSKVSRATVCRILRGDHASVSFSKVMAVADALGLSAFFDPVVDNDAFLERQAESKAKFLVGMVQGTMGLEAQGVNSFDVDRMVRETTRTLLAGSKRKLWK